MPEDWGRDTPNFRVDQPTFLGLKPRRYPRGALETVAWTIELGPVTFPFCRF